MNAEGSSSAAARQVSGESALNTAADQNVLEGDWPLLRVYIIETIRRNIQAYLDTPLPKPETPPQSQVSSTAPPSSTNSVILSSSPSTGPTQDEMNDPSLQPSTAGGLVLPPFPARPKNSAGPGEVRGPNGIVPFMSDEASIGGKTLPGKMNEETAKEESERILSLIEGFTDGPPFTLQRLAELTRSPTTHHRSVGKYLRALERILLVTSEWKPSDPSLSISNFTPAQGSTIPAGSTTPMFSPIPFLVRPDSDEPSQASSAVGMHADVPPSPLVLDQARSPTPEPETAQPFTGVVDELDAGPASSAGKGEGGNLVPHAIADHPTAITSTTTVPDTDARKVAPLPSKLGDRFVTAEKEEV